MKTNTPFKTKTNSDKKYSVYASDGIKQKLIHFGAKGYSDYTIHRDEDRKNRYIIRHKNNEDWTKKGIFTSGFWSRWILWNLPTINSSIEDTHNRFKLIVKEIV